MRRRLAGLTIALILTVPISVVAARWQWSRHLERDAMNAAVTSAETRAPVAWKSLLINGYSDEIRWRQVSISGHWQTNQLLVRKQVVDGNVGFAVLSPFATASGEVLYVLRGWVDDTTKTPPQVPAGEQAIIARVRPVTGSGDARPSDLPPGQVNWVDPSALASESGASTVDALFELIEPIPTGLKPLPWPELTAGPHVSYTIQWILIGCTAIIVYIRVLWIEVFRRKEDEEAS